MSIISEKLLLDKMTAIRTATKSSALYWVLSRCRIHLMLGERQECLTWLYKARHLAWHKTDILDKVDQCLALVYDIDPDLLSSDYWERLPVVEKKLDKLTRRLPYILPLVKEAGKRTRQKDVRLYLRSLANSNWPLRQFECLMRAEFIAADKCTDSVHNLILRALIPLIWED